VVPQVWELLKHSHITVQTREPDDLGNELIADVPAAAICLSYTAEGQRVAGYLARCTPFRDRFTAKQVAMGVWHVEAAHLDRNIGSLELGALELEARLLDWASVGITDTSVSAELCSMIADHRPLLNHVRRKIVGSAHG
jgi:hypothetical protein